MVGEQPDDDLRAPDVVIPMDDGVHDRLPEALNRNNSGSHGNRRRPSWKPSRSEETPRDTSAPGRSATAAARLRPLSGRIAIERVRHKPMSAPARPRSQVFPGDLSRVRSVPPLSASGTRVPPKLSDSFQSSARPARRENRSLARTRWRKRDGISITHGYRNRFRDPISDWR